MQTMLNGKSVHILDDGQNKTLKEAVKIKFSSHTKQDQKRIKVLHHSEYKQNPHLIEVTFSEIREKIEDLDFQIINLRSEINLWWSYYNEITEKINEIIVKIKEIDAKIEEKSQKTGENLQKQPEN